MSIADRHSKTPVNGTAFYKLYFLLIMNVFHFPSGSPDYIHQEDLDGTGHLNRAMWATKDLKQSIESEARKLTPNHIKIILNELDHIEQNIISGRCKLVWEKVEAREAV